MKKFKYEFEVIRYPLIILLVMMILRGLSNTFFASSMRDVLPDNFTWIVSLMAIIQFFSAVIIQYFPFLIVVKVLSKRHDSQRVTLIYFLSYILLLVTTLVLGKSNLADIAYQDLFTVSSVNINNSFHLNVITKPYRIGFFGAIIAGVIVNYAYKITRTRTRYGFVSYIDKDVLSLLFTIVFTLFVGLGFTFIWPYFIENVFRIFNWISDDITNPISTFVYGFIDRIFSILNLSALNRQTFWFTSFGGSWMSSAGESFAGDVTIWQESIKFGIYDSGFGRFITPHYIINLFAIPGVIVGLLSIYTDKRERFKHLSLALVLIVFTFVADLSLPFELFIIIMAPLLYMFHVVVVSSLFAILQGLKIFIGTNYIFDLKNFSLGNGIEFLSFFKNENLVENVIKLIIIGIIVLIIYLFAVRFYYNHLAIGLINKFDIEHLTNEFLEIVGGIDNVDVINSNPFRIEVSLVRPQLFNYDKLEQTQIARVIETRSVYAIYYGSASSMIRKEVLIRKSLLDD